MIKQKYNVYIIKSDQGYYYIGQTKNLEDRLNRHNSNRSKSTKNRGNWTLVTSMKFSTRSEAMQMEKKLKNFKNSMKAIKFLESQHN